MFGPVIHVSWDGFGITLRPLKKEEMGPFAEKFSSAKVHAYTLQLFGFTKEQEEQWYDRNISDKNDVTWCIVPDGTDVPIGVTGLHKIDLYQSCSSGIIIFDPTWWGKGVASAAHLARTWYATERLDRATIVSEVMEPNVASRKALEKVGYQVTGKNVMCRRVGSTFVNGLVLTWINPNWVPRLFPSGEPAEYADGIERARQALERAKTAIKLP